MTPPLVPLDLGPGLRVVVTTRHGGVSTGPYASLNLGDHVGDDPAAVGENRDRVAAGLGVPALTIADQQHGARAALVTADLAGRGHAGVADARAAFPATDALVTDVPGVALAVLVADCMPVVLHDPVRRVVAIAHCGRPGVVAGVLAATVALMGESCGTRPGDLVAGLGPGIARASYEVDEAAAAAVEAAVPGTTTPTRPGHALVDVPGAVRAQLAGLGVRDVRPVEDDTRTSADLFSDRAARPCGRFAMVAVLDPVLEPVPKQDGA